MAGKKKKNMGAAAGASGFNAPGWTHGSQYTWRQPGAPKFDNENVSVKHFEDHRPGAKPIFTPPAYVRVFGYTPKKTPRVPD